jgi:hypothetical protein
MNRSIVVSFFVALSFTVSPAKDEIKHASTVAQCQADQKLWLAERDRNDSLPFDALHKRFDEMVDCHNVDPANDHQYYNTASSEAMSMFKRMSQFIQRHKMWDEFQAEDAAGKR